VDGTTQRLWTSDLPLGVMPDEHWSRHTVMLDPGDMLVTFSDGVLDLYDGSLAAVDEVAALARASTSPQDLVDTIERLARSAAATDDVTILVLRRDQE
jgi:serine phosphatase RsbU (regulator of sigma subunit)